MCSLRTLLKKNARQPGYAASVTVLPGARESELRCFLCRREPAAQLHIDVRHLPVAGRFI